MSGKTVFVTVGTTRFDALVNYVASTPFRDELVRKGFTRLVVQHGSTPPPPPSPFHPSLETMYYSYKPDLQPDILSADLVISHAGSGTILETLTAGKAMLVVANATLMDHHQTDLALELHAQGHLVYCGDNVEKIVDALRDLDFAKLRKDGKGNFTKGTNVGGLVRVILEEIAS
ncbi:hypothetical protein BJ742DRAFT_841581 [Cladochytrium replicatum]|nr:hypothetical protein BJ742DRAFT_841581 [Cladochytrium replicatum]